MSRILIHSNAPWVPTGYGQQTRMLAAGLRDLGHEVAVSAFAGLVGADITWDGMLVMPHGQLGFGVDVLIPHIQRWEPDVTITLMDFWQLHGIAGTLKEHRIAAWLPIDCSPMSRRDLAVLMASQAQPVAMSQHGLNMIEAELEKFGPAFPEPRYIPHMVDADTFRPMPDRDEFRAELELEDQFIVGLCAANKDVIRKGFPEQFAAFQRFHNAHPDSVLLVHSTPRGAAGLDLVQLADDMGIGDCVRFSDQYTQDAGLFDTEMMVRWFNALDVLINCSYGEGFGIPILEAQACGTPAIATSGSAMKELTRADLRVGGTPFWNHVHQAWWTRPREDQIVHRLTHVYEWSAERRLAARDKAREFALDYNTAAACGQWSKLVGELCD
jgi:glycosyltransferase involved in cell wall biosynthesis